MDVTFRLLLAASLGGAALCQTQVDLRRQSKNVDFSSAASTKPLKSGTALPSTCGVGEMFFLTNGPAGSNLYGCTSTNAWSLEAGGGSGSGASMAAQLGDFQVTRSNSTTLVAGTNCSSATPCNARFGNLVYSIVSPATVTITAGTGTVFFYLNSSGTVIAGHNLTASCASGCTAQTGVTAYPLDTIPLYSWTAASGVWNPGGGTDARAFISTQLLQPGSGVLLTKTASQTTIAADSAVVGLRVSVPGTSSTACAAGAWAADGSFYYSCISTNSWRRVALTTF
jgi:hypothetical protein